MNSNRTSAGPTGFGWVRSLLTFRHRNPVARFLSALVAFAMATLLVVGSGAAYGSDTTPPPDPTATTTADPTATDPPPTHTSTPTITTTDPTPATDPTPSTTLPSVGSTVTAPSTKTTTTTRKSATGTSALTSLVSPLALITPLTNTGGFEIDGDLAVNNGGSYDWANRGDVTVDVNHDGTPTAGGTGFGDNSGYQGSSKEGNLPSTWVGFFGAQGQADIGKVYDWSQTYHDPLKGQPGHTTSPVDGHQLAYFAFTRDDTEGTMMYDVEYNRLDNSTNDPARPDRSVGDVMFQFEQQGSVTILLKGAYVWAEKGVTGWSGSCEEIDNSGFGWCPLTTTNAFTGAVGDGGRFAEGMLDLTALQFPSGTCLGDLGTMNIRSHSSLQWTSALQDYMVADVNIAGTCGSLTIEKKGLTGDTLVPGAAFSIVDDPRPGKTGTYNVFDGTTAQLAALTGTPTLPANTVADGTADGRIVVPNAEPGTYTVTELRAPAGYLLPAPADRTQDNVAVGNAGDTNADVTVTFRDPKKWAPLTASKRATGHYDIGWDITKQVSSKADPAEADWKSSDTAYSSSTTHDFKYRVRVTQQAASNYRVTGFVTVHNPNSAPVNATLTEVPGVSGASCSFDSGVGTNGAITVAPDDDPSTAAVETAGTSYPYTCRFDTPPAAGTSATGTNTAHLEWSQSAYPQNQGDVDGTNSQPYELNPSYPYSFTAATDQPVNVTVKDYATVPGQADPVHHTFTTAETGGAGTIDANGDWALAWTPGGGPYIATYSRPITGTAGQCTGPNANPNTASLFETGAATSFDDSTAKAVLCVGADVEVLDKNATGTLYRTYPWSIRKTTSTPELNSGVSTTGQYDITVTTGPGKDARWGMTGTIQVRNPNTWGDGIPVTMSDTYYTDSTMTTQVTGSSCLVNEVQTGVDGDGKPVFTTFSGAYTIPNETTATFRYTCTFDDGGDPNYAPTYTGTNKATAMWDQTLAHTPNGSDYFAYQVKNDDAQLAKSLTNDWIKNLVNDTITVYDDNATPADPTDDRHWDLTWSQVYDNNAEHSITLDASSDPSTDIVFDAPGDGTCATHTNTVTITSGGRPVVESDATEANHQSTDDNSAQVRICNPATLTGSKTATPEFTRTYNWHVVKQVRIKAQYGEPAGAWQDVTASWTGDYFSHDFEYRVIVERGTPVDSLYKMSGTITVHNPNTDSNIPPVSATVSEPATIGGVAATCSIDDGNLATPPNAAVVTLASNTPQNPNATDVTLPYTCTLAGKPADGTRNSVTVAWGAGAGESTTLQSPAPGVTYDTPTTEVDKSVTAVDDLGTTTPADDVTLGTVTWDQAGVDGYTFPVYSATHTATTTGCSTDNQWTNTVTISSGPTVKDSDSATAAICPNAGTWQVSKTSDVHDGPVPVDSDITYTLTATKTSGVNPKNVVLTDDLSSLAPHVSLPTLADLQAAAPVGTTVGLTGNVITWTIAELSGSVQLDFTVKVNADAYGVDLPNLVTSTGSDNCDPAKEGFPADECDTDNVTPHYTLRKTSDAGDQVMPPYLGQAGTLITYTLTVHNDSSAPINSTTMPNETVTDDLTDVLDNATWVGNITPADGSAVRSGNTLTWTLPAIPVDGTATLTYQVRVAGDQWDSTLKNVAAPGKGGDCYTAPVLAFAATVVNPNCTTTTRTPGYALIQALKVDADNPQQGLQGAVFTLSQGEQVIEENVVSDANGVAHFTTKLQPGTFQVTETQAPTGYALPANPTQDVVVVAADLNDGETPVQVRFDDPPIGSLALSKAHQELSGGAWVAGDGQIAFNDQVKYVITVTATGTKVFHDVVVTDYVPGYNPADTQTQLGGFKAALVGTPTCSAAFTTCSASYDAATGLVTWTLGDVGDTTGTVEFVVRMPDLPRISPLAAPGVSFAGLMWNQAYLSWTQRDDTEGTPPHTLSSNAVIDAASEVLPPQVIVSPPKPKQHHPSVLPSTGGPDGLWLAGGLALLLAGGALVLGDRRRRRRS